MSFMSTIDASENAVNVLTLEELLLVNGGAFGNYSWGGAASAAGRGIVAGGISGGVAGAIFGPGALAGAGAGATAGGLYSLVDYLIVGE